MKKISYEPLWKVLKNKKMSKNNFRVGSKISSSTFSKLINDENVTTNTLIKICVFLDCDIHDIVCCILVGEEGI